MFLGEYKHSIDTKGRLSIPAEMRNECGESVVVSKGYDGSLSVYTEESWANFYESIMALDRKKKKNREYIRENTRNARKINIDKLGRINIPQSLRDLAHLDKECTIIGSGDVIEIWDSKTLEDYDESVGDSFDDIAEEIE